MKILLAIVMLVIFVAGFLFLAPLQQERPLEDYLAALKINGNAPQAAKDSVNFFQKYAKEFGAPLLEKATIDEDGFGELIFTDKGVSRLVIIDIAPVNNSKIMETIPPEDRNAPHYAKLIGNHLIGRIDKDFNLGKLEGGKSPQGIAVIYMEYAHDDGTQGAAVYGQWNPELLAMFRVEMAKSMDKEFIPSLRAITQSLIENGPEAYTAPKEQTTLLR